METVVEAVGKSALTERPAWKALEAHYKKIRKLHLRGLFASERDRGERLTTSAAGIYFDYSKNRITGETLKLLAQLATESGLSVSLKGTVGPTQSCWSGLYRRRSANSLRSMSTPFSRRAPFGASTRSINGASNWARSWRNGSSRNWRVKRSPNSGTTVPPTP